MKKIISFLLRKIPRKYLQLFSHIVLKLITPFYYGSKVECSVCEKKFSKFLPYGRIGRPNALCPNCLSLERHRMVWLYLKEETDFFTTPSKMLHIAPELCFIPRINALKNIEYLTADIESPLADIKMDVHQIPFPDQSFTIIFCNHVMEHVENDLVAMAEIYRVLKPGGWAILQIPLFYPLPEKTFEDKTIIDPTEREKIFGQDDHVRKYGLDYSDRLKSVGFEVPNIDFINRIGKENVLKYALPADDFIFKAIKPVA